MDTAEAPAFHRRPLAALAEATVRHATGRGHRLERSVLNGTQTATSTLKFAQDWSLDALGNWSGYDRDDDGDSTYDLQQSRTHNDVNEISGISETAGSAWVDRYSWPA